MLLIKIHAYTIVTELNSLEDPTHHSKNVCKSIQIELEIDRQLMVHSW